MADDISVLQEIDESLRAEKLQQFWQRSGNLVIAGCADIILLTIAAELWKNHRHDQAMRQTSFILQALSLDADKKEEVLGLLQKAEDGTGNMAAIARLQEAKLLNQTGQPDKALALYNAITSQSSHTVDASLRDFAELQAAILTSNKGTGTITLNEKSPYSATLEMIAAATLINNGKNKDAAELLTPISTSTAVPNSERAIAQELLDVASETPR